MSAKRIWKYILQITDEQIIEVPSGAKLLHIDQQEGRLCLWMIVDIESELTKFVVNIVGTGNPVPNELPPYIGTAQIHTLVWHVFAGEFRARLEGKSND